MCWVSGWGATVEGGILNVCCQLQYMKVSHTEYRIWLEQLINIKLSGISEGKKMTYLYILWSPWKGNSVFCNMGGI